MPKKLILALDSTQLSTYAGDGCPEKWNLLYNEHLRPAGWTKKYLDKGHLMHALLDIFYSLNTMDPDEMLRQEHAAAAIEILDTAKSYATLLTPEEWTKLVTRFVQYTYRWNGNDFKPATNKIGAPAIELGFSKVLDETLEHLFIVEGRIDLIDSRFKDNLIIVDHKTQSREANLYRYRPQMLTYAWATGYRAGMYNYIGLQESYKDHYLRRDYFDIPEHLVKSWRDQMLSIFLEIKENLRINKPFRRNLAACSGDFDSNPCQFIKICEAKDVNIANQIKQFAYVQVEKWSPWGK